MDLNKLIKPETNLEESIISDKEWVEGIMWGESRPGHPEGKTLFHVLDVLVNINKLSTTKELREQLRIIALIHDTFKYKVDILKNMTGDNHHAFYAKIFAEKYIKDIEILTIIEYHDEAYAAWRKGMTTGKWDKAEERLNKLLNVIKNYINLYYLFYKVDNETGDKTQECLVWFEKYIN
jgi:hypothetical protein